MRSLHSLVFVAVAFSCLTATGEEVLPDESLRVIAYPIEPFFYLDEEGNPAGLEYEILRSFAESSSLKIDVQWTEVFAELLSKIEHGEGDVAAGTITITREREQRVDFTRPHFPAMVVLVEKKAAIATTIDGLRGERVAILGGTTYETILRSRPDIHLIYTSTDEEAFQKVDSGEADALATDSAVYLWLMEKYPRLHISFALSEREFYGFALRKGNPLKERLDAHLERMIADGSYRALLRATFGSQALSIIDSLTEEILE